MDEGIKTPLKKVKQSKVKESKARAMRIERDSHIFELNEAEIAKVRDGSMSRFDWNDQLNQLHRLRP